MSEVRVKLGLDPQQRLVVMLDSAAGVHGGTWSHVAESDYLLKLDALSPPVSKAFTDVLTELLNDPVVVSKLHRTHFFDKGCG